MRLYDDIGREYARGRRTEPRWMAAIEQALGEARTVVDVGAGTGSYEPPGREVVAVEPSEVMIAQRPPTAAPVARAVAERLPFADDAFDAALAVLTVHHWRDPLAGLHELRRVARRRVVVTFDPARTRDLWIVRDYLPGVAAQEAHVPGPEAIAAALGGAEIRPLEVPRDMVDGVLAAHWARPEAYLDPGVRANASGLARLDPTEVEEGMRRLADDLGDGSWNRKHGHLLERDALEAGYRLIESVGPSGSPRPRS